MKSILSALAWMSFAVATGNLFGQTAITRSSFNVSVAVVDDENRPVAEADAGFSWGRIGDSKLDSDFSRKLTTKEGLAEFSGSTGTNTYAYGATKDGYYPSRGLNGAFDHANHGQWQPWGKRLTVVLKPIKNPVPMYAKRIDMLVPEVGKPVGYDLEKGDWVAPYGKGMRTDFAFTVEGRYESKRDYEGVLTLRLPGEGNGIQSYSLDPVQRSQLKLPYEAPETGYETVWVWRNARKTPVAGQPSIFVDESNDQRTFIFRVRTVLDPQGQVIRANYGKIHGPVFFQTFEQGKSRVGFMYYYNPDETRNLEFDPKKNLFPQEHVIEP
jgi:hypothetical protein